MTNENQLQGTSTVAVDEKFAENMFQQAQMLFQQFKDIKETQKTVQRAEKRLMRIGKFVIDFHNEYKDHNGLSKAQQKFLQREIHKSASLITGILHPRLEESRKRGSPYFKEWNTVVRGLWSIFKHSVNEGTYPYEMTPHIKFKDALEYAAELNVYDYLAYKECRWDDIRKFVFKNQERYNVTLEDIIKDDDEEDDNNTLVLID